jgi:geranylgeranyl diphosphate synthase type I
MTVTLPVRQDQSAQRLLAQARTLAGPAHRAAVDRLPGPMRHLVGYHVGWWDADGRPAAEGNGGKAVRPALVLAAASAVGADPACAVAEAVAVELVHDFSLLHDDIMDGDLTRRHRPAAWSVFGVAEAILAGDSLMSLAADVLAGRPGLGVLTGALLELCAGQGADIAFEQRTDVDVQECMAMAAGKTGALLACACHLGAIAGGAGPAQAYALAGFGRHIGLMFQLVDDLLGIWGDPAVTGKPSGSDLAARKKSLPVVAALTSGTEAGNRLAVLYQQPGTGISSLEEMAGLVQDAGGRAWASAEADRQMRSALEYLRKAMPRPEAAADLVTLARLITGRDC